MGTSGLPPPESTAYPSVIGVVTLSSTSIPTQLGMTTEPLGTRYRPVRDSASWSRLRIAWGNPDIDYNGTVTIALQNNPSGDTLKGTLTATVNNGVAVFSGLTLNDAAQGVHDHRDCDRPDLHHNPALQCDPRCDATGGNDRAATAAQQRAT